MADSQYLKRRTLLKIVSTGLLTASITACTHKKFFNSDEDIILSGGSYSKGKTTQYALIVINLTVQEKRVIDTPFMPHDILIDPNNKYRVYCFEKNGIHACEVDLQNKSIVRHFESTRGKHFSGHAAFSENGKTLYCIENNVDSDTQKQFGYVVIRNAQTLTSKKELSTHGLLAHDCQLLDNQILAVSNTGLANSNQQQSSLIYLDLETENIISRLRATSNNNQLLNNGHFEVTKDNVVIISAPLLPLTDNRDNNFIAGLGGVSIKKQTDPLLTMNEPAAVIQRMKGEALSIEISLHNNIAAVTHPEANLITFWSIDKKQIVKAFGIEKPRGISQTVDGQHFVVSYGNKAAMAQIGTSDLTPVSTSIVHPTHASGEHIINWSKTLRKIMPKDLY